MTYRPDSGKLGKTARSGKRPRVALLIETSNAYARGLLQGVVRYIREHEPWSFHFLEQARGGDAPWWLERWDGDGIIARIENERIADAVAKSKIPAVDVSSGRHLPSIPWVETDDEKIADLAARHLLERGFRNFGYCGDDQFHWSRRRKASFTAILQAAGYQCSVFEPPHSASDRQVAAMVEWLTAIPKPAAIFAGYDVFGQQILHACRNAGLAVPDDVAVLGVDDDELICELATPPLSSIGPDTFRTGYEAAALLARLMKGERVGNVEVLIPPLGVHCRQSTDVLATDDPHIVQAVRFIREHACDAIQVKDVLRKIPLSRKILETRFKRLLNRTIHEEILRVKFERVKQFLSDTDFTLDEIAGRTGCEHAEYLSVAFKREVGVTPRVYRASHQKVRRRLGKQSV
jgi:LacI family transcriptional regulator